MFPCHVNMRHAMSRWSCRRNSPLNYHLTMSTKGRSASPPSRDVDVDMERQPDEKPDPKVIVITNLTRNVVEPHLQSIFGFYGEVIKIDLPTYVKCVLLHMLGFLSFSSYFSPFSKKQLLFLSSRAAGQNKGKASLEYADTSSARTAASHMNGGQLDGAALKVELSDAPLRTRSRSPPPPFRPRNGRERERERERPRSPLSPPRSRSRSRSPRFQRRERNLPPARAYNNDSYRRPPLPPQQPSSQRRPPQRDVYRPRPRTRSRSPVRRAGMLGPRRRSPSYERGGYGRARPRSRSYTSSVRSSRSGSRTPSRSRSWSRSRSRSFSRSRSRSGTRSRSRSRSPSYSSYSRGRTRSRSYSRGRRSYSRDDIRDSRSRSPHPKDA